MSIAAASSVAVKCLTVEVADEMGLQARTYRFGDFELDARSGELQRHGRKVRLSEQPFQVLVLLLAHPGEVVTREQVRQALWPEATFVDFEAGLNSAVWRLREALNDSAEKPRFVETLPRRGYRLIAAVEPSVEPSDAPAPEGETGAVVRPAPGLSLRFVLAGAAVVALLVVLTVTATWQQLRSRPAPAQIRSLAVLPFENLTGDQGQDYFADGMTDALTTDLAQIRALRVISRTSAMQYKGARKPLPRIAQELDVDVVVEGSVTRSGGRVRVNAQLIHAATDRHLWARSYERELRDVLALQGEVAGAIAQAIRVEVRPEERSRLAGVRVVDPDAYDAYLKGRFFWSKQSRDGLLKAVEYFQQAIEKDPTYAPAHSGLSDTYRQFDQQGLAPPRECMPKAEAAARKALDLDEVLAEAHASLAGVLYRYRWDWEGAEKEFRVSLELDPNSAEGHRAYATYLATVRRHEESLAEVRRARELSPLSPSINTQLGRALARVGRYDEAIDQFRRVMEIDPGFSGAYVSLGQVYLRNGDLPQAIAAFEKAAALSSPRPQRWLGYVYGVTGRRPEALKILAALERLSRQQYVPPLSFAIVHLGLGDKQSAMTLLEEAYPVRALEVPDLSGEVFDLLRDEPRFRALLRRMGLPVQGRALAEK
jgi:TolB-like protein/DNA-binding winged helix-turn-helix (wHTH) protein/Tfp pilus assembly protein PilF